MILVIYLLVVFMYYVDVSNLLIGSSMYYIDISNLLIGRDIY